MKGEYEHNKRAKLVAAIAVMAMVFAGMAVVLQTDDSVAETDANTSKYDEERDGPLNFDATGTYGETGFSNSGLNNHITVAYDDQSKTYTITGVLAKQDLTKTNSAFYKMWEANTEYLYGLAFHANVASGATIKVGNGEETGVSDGSGEDCFLYIKDAKISTVKIGDVEYTIDFSGVTLSDSASSNPSAGYVVIPNSNAIAATTATSGTDGSDGKWKFESGTLTLTNYNGKEYFEGAISQVILVGENKITLDGAASAIKSSSAMTIKSIDGVGSLAIEMDASATGAKAIDTSGKLTINGVSVSVTMTETYSTENAASYDTRAINSAGFDIYDATLKIDIAKDNLASAYGIVSNGDVDIKSSLISISAGSRGINTDGNVSIAASEIAIEADQLGIRAWDNDKKVSITNESVVNVKIYGLAEGYGRAYGVSGGSIEVQSDSVLTTTGMIIYNGTSINNATINISGEMMIWTGATFNNAGKFVNTGIVGVYGTFKNSAGETVNQGTINNYDIFRADSWSGKTLVSKESDNGRTLTLTVNKIMPLADGTFLAEIGANITPASDESSRSTHTESDTVTYLGTIVFNNNGYTIDATSDDGVLSVVYDEKSTTAKYSIYSSDKAYSLVTGDGADESKPVSNDGVKEITKTNNSGISITGGQFTNAGNVSISAVCAEFVTGGKFVNEGVLSINENITTTGGSLSGNDAVIAAGVTITLEGDIDMSFSHNGSYTVAATGTTPASTVSFTDVISVKGKVVNAVINTIAVSNMGGFVAITGISGDAKITVLEGSASFTGTVDEKTVLAVASGATLQILNTATATAGVVAVQDGATLNMKVNTDRDTYRYGTLTYTISFANNGYTYYGSLQYALANAAEGATLNLNGEAEINTTTVVKKGITLQFADNAKLSITGTEASKTALSMEDGAKFVLGKGSEVTITPAFVTVSGTFVYDVNEIVLDKVVLKTADGITNKITTVAATSTVASSIGISMNAVDGTVTASKGTATGTIAINNELDGGKLKTTAKLVVAKDAVANVTFTDNAYAKNEIDGTLKISAATTISGAVSGTGMIVLKDGTGITFASKATADVAIGNGTDSFAFAKVVNGDSDTFTVTAIAKSGAKAAYITVTGSIVAGTVTAAGNTAFGNGSDEFTIGTEATVVVPADATLTIIKIGDDSTKNTANGLLKVAGTLNMKVADDSATAVYGTLNYQITYSDGSYTVYTMVATAVKNASPGDSFTLDKNLEVSGKLEVPSGVTIIVAEGKKIILDNNDYILIGSGITTIGATGGIQGTVQLSGNAYVVEFADATMDNSKMKLVGSSDADKIVNSQVTALNVLYATVYAIDGRVSFSDVKSNVQPSITGYRFVNFTNAVGGGADAEKIGSADFVANMVADKVQVTFQKVEGITYYVDNVKQNTVGAPVYISYGATVTAVADYGYSGNALVNGKAYVTIDSTVSEIVGSGVTKTEATTSSDDGMGLTDILLVVLVVLIAVMAIMVALRMMRS